MDTIKKFFPLSFREKNSVGELVVNVIIQVVIAVVVGVLIGLLSGVPVLGWIITLLGGLIDLYFTAGIVFSFLHYFKVIK